eukprot:7279968-Prymnesium_polylepis.1
MGKGSARRVTGMTLILPGTNTTVPAPAGRAVERPRPPSRVASLVQRKKGEAVDAVVVVAGVGGVDAVEATGDIGDGGFHGGIG